MVCGGGLLGLVCVEGALRLGGAIYLWRQEHPSPIVRNRQGATEYVVMCIGESTTAGFKDSYPSQLQQILNERAKDMSFRVINRGVPATTTDAILERLPTLLDHYHPDIVVAMMGINDSGNIAPRFQVYGTLRVWKLIRLLWEYATEAFGGTDAELLKKSSEQSHWDRMMTEMQKRWRLSRQEARLQEQTARRVLERNGNDLDALQQLGDALKAQHQREAARNVYRRAVHIAPADPNVVHIFALSLMPNRAEEARNALLNLERQGGGTEETSWLLGMVEWILFGQDLKAGRLERAEELVRRSLARPGVRKGRAYAGLAELYRRKGDLKAARTYEQRARHLFEDEYSPRTARNYASLKRMLGERGTKLVAVQYPNRPLTSLKNLIPTTNGVLFVDNEQIFREAVGREGYDRYFVDRFAGDFGHLTREGNRLLAENVASVLLKALSQGSGSERDVGASRAARGVPLAVR